MERREWEEAEWGQEWAGPEEWEEEEERRRWAGDEGRGTRRGRGSGLGMDREEWWEKHRLGA